MSDEKLPNVPIASLKEGMKVSSVYYLCEASEKKTKDNRPYCDFKVRDKSGVHSARLWGPLNGLRCFSYVAVQGFVEVYNSVTRLIIEKIMNVEPTQINEDDFIRVIDNLEICKETLKKTLERLTVPTLKTLVANVFSDSFTEQFCRAPASEGTRYGAVGGTLLQVCRVMSLAENLVKEHGLSDEQAELIVAGVLLANTGKVVAYDFVDNMPVQTIKGTLYGEVALSYQRLIMILMKIKQDKKEPVVLDDELVMRLVHVVLSSRSATVFPFSTVERRCVVIPQSVEAVVVSQAYFTDEHVTDVTDFIGASETTSPVEDPFTVYDTKTRRHYLKK
jgi:23S rRNA maturation-related 3'-5' exoribonuclease YhaM